MTKVAELCFQIQRLLQQIQDRGVHLVTDEVLRQVPELKQFSVGMCHLQTRPCASNGDCTRTACQRGAAEPTKSLLFVVWVPAAC